MTTRRRWLTLGAALLLTPLSGIALAQEAPRPASGEIPELPPLEDLSATTERPLFVRSRRPPEAAPPAPAEEAAPVEVAKEEAPAELTGIVNGPDRTYAILRSVATKEVVHLRKGETIDDWSVQEIGVRYVVLRRGAGSLRLELFAEKEPDAAGRLASDDDRMPNNARPRFVPQQQFRQPPRQQRPRPSRQQPRRRAD
jgi:general secretion pathway protein N